MQFWLKMYIFTHASVFNVVLSLKLLLMGHILWALIPASDLYIWKVWAERENGKRKKRPAVRAEKRKTGSQVCESRWVCKLRAAGGPGLESNRGSDIWDYGTTGHTTPAGLKAVLNGSTPMSLLTAARKSLSKWFTEGVCSLQCQKSWKTIFLFKKKKLNDLATSPSVCHRARTMYDHLLSIYIYCSLYIK